MHLHHADDHHSRGWWRGSSLVVFEGPEMRGGEESKINEDMTTTRTWAGGIHDGLRYYKIDNALAKKHLRVLGRGLNWYPLE